MNVRAFVQPPVYEFKGGKHVVITTMYHWNGHPKYGFSTDETEFASQDEAMQYIEHLGYREDDHGIPRQGHQHGERDHRLAEPTNARFRPWFWAYRWLHGHSADFAGG